jgi:hypothetical protein
MKRLLIIFVLIFDCQADIYDDLSDKFQKVEDHVGTLEQIFGVKKEKSDLSLSQLPEEKLERLFNRFNKVCAGLGRPLDLNKLKTAEKICTNAKPVYVTSEKDKYEERRKYHPTDFYPNREAYVADVQPLVVGGSSSLNQEVACYGCLVVSEKSLKFPQFTLPFVECTCAGYRGARDHGSYLAWTPSSGAKRRLPFRSCKGDKVQIHPKSFWCGYPKICHKGWKAQMDPPQLACVEDGPDQCLMEISKLLDYLEEMYSKTLKIIYK